MNHTTPRIGRRLLAATAATLMVAGGTLVAGGAAVAAPVPGPVTEQDGSLTIHKHLNPGFDGTEQNPDGSEGAGGDPLNGVTFLVCAIDGIDLIDGGNAAWDELNALGVIASAVTSAATTIGSHDLVDCDTEVTANVAGADGVAVFDELPVGAYLVRETVAPANIVEKAAPFVVAIPTPAIGEDAGNWLYDVHVYPKNQALDDPTKTIADQGTDVLTGAEVGYSISQRIPAIAAGESYDKLVVTDALDAKLTPGDIADVVVTLDGTELDIDEGDYTAAWSGQTLTVTLTGALADLEEGDMLVVSFTATVNANGVIVNTAVVNVNDLVAGGRETPGVDTRWGAVDLVKYNASDADQPGLEGAEFELWMGSTATTGCAAATTGNVKIADVVSGPAGVIGTVTAGVFTALPGLWVGDDSSVDADLATRCYFLVETKAPAGFVLPLTAADRTTEFIVHPQETAHLEATRRIANTQQIVPGLPLTGSDVQVILTVVGSALLALALGIVLVRRRRAAQQ